MYVCIVSWLMWYGYCIDKLVNLDRSKMRKCVRYFLANIGWFMEYKRFLLDSITYQYQGIVAHSGRQMAYWFLQPNTIFRSYSFSPAYVGEYRCTVVGLGLLVFSMGYCRNILFFGARPWNLCTLYFYKKCWIF